MINRREFLRNSLAASALLASPALFPRLVRGQGPTVDKRPNIVWLVADDMSPTLG